MTRAHAFTASAAAVISTAALLAPHAPQHAPARSAGATVTLPARATTPPPRRAGDTPSAGDVAQRFLNAYAAYEAGHTRQRPIRATTTAGLAEELLGQPVRGSRSSPTRHARVVSLRPTGRAGAAAAYDVWLQRGRRVSVITVGLVRIDGRWRVASVR